MCLCCIEYNKGNLTLNEFKNGIKEYVGVEHDPKAIEDLPEEVDSEDLWSNNLKS